MHDIKKMIQWSFNVIHLNEFQINLDNVTCYICGDTMTQFSQWKTLRKPNYLAVRAYHVPFAVQQIPTKHFLCNCTRQDTGLVNSKVHKLESCNNWELTKRLRKRPSQWTVLTTYERYTFPGTCSVSQQSHFNRKVYNRTMALGVMKGCSYHFRNI